MLLMLLACKEPPTEVPPTEPVCGVSTELLQAPAPIDSDAGLLAAVDIHAVRIDAVLTEQGVAIEAEADFLVGEDDGLATFELAAEPVETLLDGASVSWSHQMVGDPERQVFVLDAPLSPCTEHTLSVSYTLPIGWLQGAQARLESRPGGVFWSAGLEDARSGNFLGMWAPSNLLFDRFDLDLSMDLHGLEQSHSVVSTGERDGFSFAWTAIQAHTPFWVVSPDSETESATFTAQTAEGPVTVEVHAFLDDPGADVQRAGERAVAALEKFSDLFGPYGHGDRYLIWIRNDQSSSMEYDGATVTAMGAIEHEIMHSWYARGASPRTDADGWVDEAVTSWVTDFIPLRAHATDYTLDPTTLRHGEDGWDGPQLDISQYVAGSAIFADIAHRHSVDDVVDALGVFYRERVGDSYSDVELEEHLTCWFDAEVRTVFFHRAYGAGPPEGVPEEWCSAP